MKIRKKASLLFVSLFVIAFLIVGIITVFFVKNNITQLISNNLKAISSIQLNRIENINSQNLERFNLISSRTQLRISLSEYGKNPQEKLQQKMNAILEDARLSVADFDQISIINLTGEIVSSTNKTIIGENADLNDSVFILSQKQNITNIYNLDEKGNLKIYMYGPLVYNNKTQGILFIVASSEKIQNFLSDYSGLGNSGYTSVVFTDKYKDRKPIISPIRHDSSFQYKQVYYDELGQISKHILDKKTGIFQNLLDNKQERMFASIEYSENLNLGLSVRISKSEVLKPLKMLLLLLVIVMMTMIIILVFVINYSTKLISKPIVKLTERADLISKGNLDQKIEINSKDEVGLLAKSLNTMVANLHESEGRWQFALESSGDGVWDWNAETNEVFFSKRWKEMLGYTEDEIANNFNEWDKILHPDEKEKNYYDLNKFLNGETVFLNLEHRLLCKDGTYKWILSRGKIISRTKENKPLRIIGTHIDLTEHKRAEEALIIEREFAEKIIETSIAIIVGLDKNHLIRIFNKGAEIITGYTKAEMIGKDWFEILFPNELLSEMNKVWKDAWGIQSPSYENPIIVRTGEERIISWQSSGFYEDKDINNHLLISIGEDITEQNKAEEALKSLSSMVEQSTEGMARADLNGNFMFVNNAWCKMHGYENAKDLGLTQK